MYSSGRSCNSLERNGLTFIKLQLQERKMYWFQDKQLKKTNQRERNIAVYVKNSNRHKLNEIFKMNSRWILREGMLLVVRDSSVNFFPWHTVDLNPRCWSNSDGPSTAQTVAGRRASPAALLLFIPACPVWPAAPQMSPLRPSKFNFYFSIGINHAELVLWNKIPLFLLISDVSQNLNPHFQREMHF